jgi:RimJ/RimL family protein N-acetyltransferase/mannose-6-phosphate isomerase-like protein (cupin superfamily)
MIRTRRLELRNATATHLRAELEGREAFAALLGAAVPDNWPPELYDEDAVRWGLKSLGELGVESDAFLQYWFVASDAARQPTVIGVGGFKGRPVGGAVELGYGVLEQFRRRGYATEATAALASFAFGHAEVSTVVAQTLPHLTPSIGVLEKCGFHFEGEGDAAGVIRFVLSREEWQRRQPTSGAFAAKMSLVTALWQPKLIARVNDTDVRLARIQGDFIWHRHDAEDEMFVVLAGRMLMQFRDREQWVGPGEFIVVPRGVEHRPVAPEEVQLLLIEPSTTLNTGNVVNERTVSVIDAI